MNKARLEAFSDGVLAIVITIMVLELKVPAGGDFASLSPLVPILLSYVLSFVYVAIYWNNHHHLLSVLNRLTPGVMWANMHFLFWLTLTPFVTEWVGLQNTKPQPAVAYGLVFAMAAIAYKILQHQICATTAHPERFRSVFGRDLKGIASPILYLLAMGLAFVSPWISYALYAVVALLWIVPDKRLARLIEARDEHH